MKTLIITEKSSQAKDLRVALGDRFGQILPAEGHSAIGEMVEDLLADELPFTVTIGRQDHLIAALQRRGDGLEF